MWIIETMGKVIGHVNTMPEVLNFVSIAKKEGYVVDSPVVQSPGIFLVVIHPKEKSCTQPSP